MSYSQIYYVVFQTKYEQSRNVKFKRIKKVLAEL